MTNIRIIDFYADWCVPCKQYDVILPELTEELGFELEKVNVEFNQDMVDQYEVQGLPTLVILDGDSKVGQLEGASSKQVLKDKLKKMLGSKMPGDLTGQQWEDPPKQKFIK